MKALNYYVSLFLIVLLCILDGFSILGVIVCIGESAGALIMMAVFTFIFLFLTVKCYKWHKKYAPACVPKKNVVKESFEDDEIEDGDEPLYVSSTVKETGLEPNYEIGYKNAEGEVSRRKIAVISFDGKVIEAYCFLRKERRTFYVPRITECVDLSTGEVVGGDLRVYFAKVFNIDPKPCNIYRYEEWLQMSYSSLPDFPDDLNDFEIDEKLNLDIMTFEDGERRESFYCGKVYKSSNDVDDFYVQLTDSKGKYLNAGFSKIISVEGAESFSSFVLQKFYQSEKGRASKLVADYRIPLSILIYLGRADSSLIAAKRQFICEYMQFVGADCSDEVLVKAARKIKVELSDFKKLVNTYAKFIEESQKNRFMAAVESVIGGREKAKPFGLAGLQYIESKIKA